MLYVGRFWYTPVARRIIIPVLLQWCGASMVADAGDGGDGGGAGGWSHPRVSLVMHNAQNALRLKARKPEKFQRTHAYFLQKAILLVEVPLK